MVIHAFIHTTSITELLKFLEKSCKESRSKELR